MKRFGILCDGGDAPGINAAIRAVARAAFEQEDEVLGFKDGFLGLINNDVRIITKHTVSGILPLGGSILGISRFNPLRDPKYIQSIKENFKKNALTLLVIIGDRDTITIANKLAEEGVPSIVIPKTIDNDIYGTDYSIGFNTAITKIGSALDDLHSTASAHHRVMVVETMGRETGWLALFGGLAGGADYIIIPEVPYKIEDVASHIESRKKEGKNFSIVVVAEGAPLPGGDDDEVEKDEFGHPINRKRRVGYTIMEHIEKLTHIKSRTTVLGYIQRGGTPTVDDRILATRLGVAAVDFASQGKFNGVVGVKDEEIIFTPLSESAGKIHKVDEKFYDIARIFF